MDEYEKLAFELDVIYQRLRRTYPRDKFTEDALADSIDQFRWLSRTYRPPISIRTPKLD